MGNDNVNFISYDNFEVNINSKQSSDSQQTENKRQITSAYHSLVVEKDSESSDIRSVHVIPELHLTLRSGARELGGHQTSCVSLSLCRGFHVDVMTWNVELFEKVRIQKTLKGKDLRVLKIFNSKSCHAVIFKFVED
jgi:hypothetical protein